MSIFALNGSSRNFPILTTPPLTSIQKQVTFSSTSVFQVFLSFQHQNVLFSPVSVLIPLSLNGSEQSSHWSYYHTNEKLFQSLVYLCIVETLDNLGIPVFLSFQHQNVLFSPYLY